MGGFFTVLCFIHLYGVTALLRGDRSHAPMMVIAPLVILIGIFLYMYQALQVAHA